MDLYDDIVEEEILYFDEIEIPNLYMLLCGRCATQIPVDIVDFSYFESETQPDDEFLCELCADIQIFGAYAKEYHC